MNVRIRLQCGRSVTFERCAADMRQSEPECALSDLDRRFNPGNPSLDERSDIRHFGDSAGLHRNSVSGLLKPPLGHRRQNQLYLISVRSRRESFVLGAHQDRA
jgi:hypothetical protein